MKILMDILPPILGALFGLAIYHDIMWAEIATFAVWGLQQRIAGAYSAHK